MDRINTATKALDLFGPGKHGFKDGDLALAIQPTDLEALYFNDLQEEFVGGLIEYVGLVPTPGVRNQIRQAIEILIARATGNDYKASVRAATVGTNITLAGGAPNTLDGVALAANDRILVKDQAAGSQNGIYYVATLGTGANGTWTRATDADGAGELTSGAIIAVEEGTLYADSQWMLTTDGAITLGTTALNFTRKDSSTAATGFRNKIINGGMAVDQRNAGAAQTFTAAAALAYCVDRWYGYCTGANVNGQRVAGSGANQYRYQFSGAASVTGIGFGQRIEKANCIDLAGSTATLSVDLANSLLTTVNWTAYYANTDDTFGTLASPTRTQIATGSFTVNSTVTRYSTRIAIPGAATTGIEVVFSVGAQTSGTWVVGNVQLEAGASATSFERRPIASELAAAQRYFELHIAGGFYLNNAEGSWWTSSFKATKRVTPTVAEKTLLVGGGTASGFNAPTSVNETGMVITLATGAFGYRHSTFTVSAEL